MSLWPKFLQILRGEDYFINSIKYLRGKNRCEQLLKELGDDKNKENFGACDIISNGLTFFSQVTAKDLRRVQILYQFFHQQASGSIQDNCMTHIYCVFCSKMQVKVTDIGEPIILFVPNNVGELFVEQILKLEQTAPLGSLDNRVFFAVLFKGNNARKKVAIFQEILNYILCVDHDNDPDKKFSKYLSTVNSLLLEYQQSEFLRFLKVSLVNLLNHPKLYHMSLTSSL